MSKMYVNELLPKDAATITAPNLQLPAGSVIQVVSTTKTDTFSMTGQIWTDVPGLTVTITPKSLTNKILINMNVMLGTNSFLAYMRLLRGNTVIGIADATGTTTRPLVTGTTGSYAGGNEQYNSVPVCMQYLDSPSTISSITYKIQITCHTTSPAGYVNRTAADRDANYYDPRGISTITAMEIAQ